MFYEKKMLNIKFRKRKNLTLHNSGNYNFLPRVNCSEIIYYIFKRQPVADFTLNT